MTMNVKMPILVTLAVALIGSTGFSETVPSDQANTESPVQTEQSHPVSSEVKSPWMVVPTLSSDPKMGTSLGAMAGYLFKLNPESTSSMVGAMATFSNTDSRMGGLFLRSFWDADRKRLNAIAAGGIINNDYSDFLGSGLPVSTTDDMKFFFVRYLQAVGRDWFVGGQGVYTNYMIVGDDFRTQEILKALGLTGYDSGALGLVLMYDDRNNQNRPTRGKNFTAHNLSYREAFGGEENFDAVRVDFKHYISHGENNVLAYRVQGRCTFDAPNSGYSSVDLRGYTRGQYLAPHSIAVEAEERWQVKGPFGLNLFGGVACLYGDGKSCGDQDNLYPMVGLGAQYVIKASEQMVVSVDYAKGRENNNGFYVRFGQSF